MAHIDRRGFLKGIIGAGASLIAVDGIAGKTGKPGKLPKFDAKGLPTAYLGSTGVKVPRIVLGLGSRFCHQESDEVARNLLNYALDNGLYYWDTAHTYDNTIGVPPGKKRGPRLIVSEERLGPVVKERRKEIFLSTKLEARKPDEIKRQLELSLQRLQTDRLDMLMIHGVKDMADVEQMSQPGHMIDILQQARKEGVTRFIGFSGHADPAALKEMAQRAKFDNMLVAMNHWQSKQGFDREGIAFPAAKEKKMGLLLMKVVRPKELIPGLSGSDLVQYALSLDGPDACVIGIDNMEVLKSNLEILRNFKKLPAERMKELAEQLQPFYRHENVPWMEHGYIDGHWVSHT